MVHVQVVLRRLVDVDLEVAHLLIRPRAQQHQVRRLDRKVLDLGLGLLVGLEALGQVRVVVVVLVEGEVLAHKRERLVVAIFAVHLLRLLLLLVIG